MHNAQLAAHSLPLRVLKRRSPCDAVCGVQVVIGASVVAAGAYALTQLIGPYAAKAYRRLYGIDESPEQAKQRDEDRRTADLVAAAIQSQVQCGFV